MAKPSIGPAITMAEKKENKKEIKELTVLKEDAKDSIYSLVFSEIKQGGVEHNE